MSIVLDFPARPVPRAIIPDEAGGRAGSKNTSRISPCNRRDSAVLE
jgi:hypothetical protein